MTITLTGSERLPLSLADRAYLTLRERLVTLQIEPGAPIDDVQVGAELQCGRTPVREAFKRLEDDRLVIAFPRRGTFAAGVDITNLAHINEIRLELEPLAARRAAQQATPSQRDQMRGLIARFDSVDELPADRTDLIRLDLAVHRAIYRAAGNPHLEDVLIRHHHLATRIFCLFLPRLGQVAEHVNEHAALLTAIITGGANAAAEIAEGHVAGFEAAVRAVI